MAQADKAQRCPNYATNIKQCPCTSTSCTRHGVCCECLANHVGKGGKSACMRGAERPIETMALPIGKNLGCHNREQNKTRCVCGETGCARHGLCCDCVRYHWGNKAWPSVTCIG